ncbi:UNVERIFIED_CONTAM: F-box protein SKIP2 [Sesamum latifolium]|uniref:F-box protein SKIP2 n=1 Tax=Sesamum latifolium TaxID=2727402 RepID=A0AAW2TYY0_9LAMI
MADHLKLERSQSDNGFLHHLVPSQLFLTAPFLLSWGLVVSPPATDTVSASPGGVTSDLDDAVAGDDFTLNLPDECLACIFQSLSAGDRKRSSLVCRRWLRVEGQSHHRFLLKCRNLTRLKLWACRELTDEGWLFSLRIARICRNFLVGLAHLGLKG